jgi:hypothetical protein
VGGALGGGAATAVGLWEAGRRGSGRRGGRRRGGAVGDGGGAVDGGGAWAETEKRREARAWK